MKIIYYALLDVEPSDGVTKKILSQCRAWVENSSSVILVVKSISKLAREMFPPEVTLFESNKEEVGGIFRKLKEFNADIIYVRNLSFSAISLFRKFNSSVRVVEINSIESEEIKKYDYGRDCFGFIKRFIRSYYIRCFVRNCWHAVSVTDEIGQELRSKYSFISVVTIPNGVSLDEPSRIKNKDQVGKLKVVFVGTSIKEIDIFSHWHGVDKLIDFAGRHLDICDVTIIGDVTSGYKHEFPGNVKCLGSMPADEASIIIKEADVGVGTLALHRKKMNEASPLKLIEYIALGLPVIYAHSFANFQGIDVHKDLNGAVLELPNFEENINNNDSIIIDFFEKCRGFSGYKREIQQCIDAKLIEKKRFEYFCDLNKRQY